MVTHVRNAEYTKIYNRKLILNLLINKSASRADLARLTGLSRASLSIIADELISEKVILETGVVMAKRGRNPMSLSINPNSFYAVGVYLNRSGYQIGLVNIMGHCIAHSPVHFLKDEPIDVMIDKMAEVISDILTKHRISKEHFLGIGLSVPGPIDKKNGIILNPPGFKAWHNVSISDRIRKRTGYQVYFDDNADSLATYNKRYGNVKNCDDFLLLLVDSGVGSGIVSDGKVHHGSLGMSSEIGHMTIDCMGRSCLCGNVGCLELYAAIPNILNEFHNTYSSWKMVIKDARRNVKLAIDILEKEAFYLSAGITNIINLLDIHTILLSGDILEGYDLLIPILKEKIQSKIIVKDTSEICLLPSLTPENFKIAAAANIAFNSFLEL